MKQFLEQIIMRQFYDVALKRSIFRHRLVTAKVHMCFTLVFVWNITFPRPSTWNAVLDFDEDPDFVQLVETLAIYRRLVPPPRVRGICVNLEIILFHRHWLTTRPPRSAFPVTSVCFYASFVASVTRRPYKGFYFAGKLAVNY